MRLPKEIYEPLPYLYPVAGVAIANYLHTFTGDISALFLFLFSGIVFLARSNHRQNLHTQKGDTSG